MSQNDLNTTRSFESFECLLDRENSDVYNDDTPLYKIKRGARLSVKPVKVYGGGFRLQVWNVAEPIGLIPEHYTDIICAATNNFDVICLAAGIVPLKEKNKVGLLVRVDFSPLEKKEKEPEPVQEPKKDEYDDSVFEFKMGEPILPDDYEPTAVQSYDFEVKQQPFYKTPLFMVLMCVFCLPVGLFFVWKFGRQTFARKLFFSVFITAAVIGSVFLVKLTAKGITTLIIGDSYKQTATDFLLAWQESSA